MTNRQFEKTYYPKYKSIITAIARKYAGPDQDLFEDLVSAGMLGLLSADLRKPFKSEDAFLRQIIRNKVIDHLRWLAPERFERLDRHLAEGDQVVKDEDSGEIRMVRHDRRRECDVDRLPGLTRKANPYGSGMLAEEDYDG